MKIRKLLLVGMVFVVLMSAPLTMAWGANSPVKNELYSEVASTLAGRPAEVWCYDPNTWEKFFSGLDGFAVVSNGFIGLRPLVCSRLAGLVDGNRPWIGTGIFDTEATAYASAVDALAHEAMHVGGIVSESVTECVSGQLVEQTARLLGIEKEYAHQLEGWNWRYVYPARPALYRSRDCPGRWFSGRRVKFED